MIERGGEGVSMDSAWTKGGHCSVGTRERTGAGGRWGGPGRLGRAWALVWAPSYIAVA